jgi:AcrR family transcriptional regulator
MPKSDGDKTRTRILEVAENLIAQKGYEGAGMGEIAKQTGINKATIYYHFKDKKDILVSLFNQILEALELHIRKPEKEEKTIPEKIKGEILFLRSKKKILSILLVEALKEKDFEDVFFKCADNIIKNELIASEREALLNNKITRDKLLIHEFYTGIIPLVSFVVFQDKWCTFFKCDEERVVDEFVKVFMQTHIETHVN